MATVLHYSSAAVKRRSAWMLAAAIVVVANYVAHAGGGFPRVFGLSFVPSAVVIATALYLIGSTVVLTLGLVGGGGAALAMGEDGLTIRTAWWSATTAWGSLSHVALEVRIDRSSQHTVVAVHDVSGLARCHTVDTRLLAEPLDRITAWVSAAERERVARGGAPRMVRSGLAATDAMVPTAAGADSLLTVDATRGASGVAAQARS